MPLELFTNAATPTTARSTTLAAAMLIGDTTLTVASSTGFPAAVTGVSQFRTLIESEIVIVTNVSGVTWTVTRGAEGTAAAAHASAVAVNATVTAGALEQNSPRPTSAPTVGGTKDYIVPGVALRGVGNAAAIGANLIIYLPVVITEPKTLTEMAVEVTTAVAASSLRIGLYRMNDVCQPTSLVFDSGLLGSATTGKKSVTTSTSLAPGPYLAAVASDAAVQIRVGIGNIINNTPVNGATFGGGGNVLRGMWQVTSTFGAFAASGVAWTTSSDGLEPTYPIIAFRF